MIDFSDLDDLGSVNPASAKADLGTLVPTDITHIKHSGVEYREKCPKCSGTGVYRGYSTHGRHCFKCQGTGVLVFKSSPEARAKGKAAAAKKKQKKADAIAAKFHAFEAAHPDIVEWWSNTDFEFAVSLRSACHQYGELTDRQLAAAKSCIAKLAAAKAARAEAEAKAREAAPEVSVATIEASLRQAQDKGIKNPKILLAGAEHSFTFTLAKAHSRNAGAVYVTSKDSGDYLGKIVDGRFLASRDCSSQQSAEVVEVTRDPAQSAIAYGKRFGVCSCCGRELTNGESIDRGIGPICFEKYFGG